MIRARMDDISAKGRLRTLRAVNRISPRECEIDGKRLIDFSSNDYMGLSMRPELMAGAIEWTRRFGTGSGASRLISGTSGAALELEAKIAEWKGFESALILSSGYSANLGVISALANKNTAIFADKLNHASINTGCLLSQAEFKRYRHSDMNHLRRLIANTPNEMKLLASDTVFSMDGDVAPLEELHKIAREANAMIFLDDAHGTGGTGRGGKGYAAPENCDVSLATFSKAVGSSGGCLLSTNEVREYLINTCSPFIFSTAMPPSTLGAISAAVDLLRSAEMDEARAHLHEISAYARQAVHDLGYACGNSETMIIPVIIADPPTGRSYAARASASLAAALRPTLYLRMPASSNQ